ncbi:MAG: response regulator transcription factor [Tissierellia bacterium]|nr:response regulator transcription factor [Tissierellia bacterium]MDD4726564.1 response regulator transcription factor [Tissierellia bacterium]
MKILIVDDHPLVRKGVLSTLSFEKDIEKIMEASNINEGMSLLRKERPDLVIVDLYLGDEDGLEIIERARKNKFDTKFLVLTSSLKKEDFNRAEEFGVDGYILKEAFVEDILYAIHVVMRGQRFVDPEILKYSPSNNIMDNHLSELTRRERDVLAVLAKGMSNQQIADELFISEHTVKKHVSSILSKLELEHRTQAALLVNDRMYF